MNGVTLNELNECPRMYCNDPTPEDHAFVTLDEDEDGVVLHFFLRRFTSVLETEPVGLEEFDRHAYPRIEPTATDLDWDPSSTVYENQENATLNYSRKLLRPGSPERAPLALITSVTTSTYMC